ncbi:hypothetical protein GGD61_004995 [Bradyrhizobium sp. SBR1B]|nr:hypothetical protein [Bradyrhizobium sp. SBR1B]
MAIFSSTRPRESGPGATGPKTEWLIQRQGVGAHTRQFRFTDSRYDFRQISPSLSVRLPQAGKTWTRLAKSRSVTKAEGWLSLATAAAVFPDAISCGV